MGKRFAAFSLAVILLVSVLSACKSDPSKPAPAEPTPLPTDNPQGDDLDLELAGEFTVSNCFSSDMVLQRNEWIRVWGWAPEAENGRKICADFKECHAECEIADGKWELTFKAKFEADENPGNAMRIWGSGIEKVFKDVLIGDVFMVVGQSNIDYSMQGHLNSGAQEWTLDDLDKYDPIRLFLNSTTSNSSYPTVGTADVSENILNKRGWQKGTSGNVLGFSALGYFLAYHYVNLTEKKIPVGIIEIAANGMPLASFLPNSLAEEYGTDYFDEAKGIYIPTEGHNPHYARAVYNNLMYPWERYALSGLVWYQGESNNTDAWAAHFEEPFAALMQYMRGTHNLTHPDYPIYIMEFPPCYKEVIVPGTSWSWLDLGLIRPVIAQTEHLLSNTYVVASSDLWSGRTYPNNLHPPIKYGQGLRLAKLIASVNEGIGSFDTVYGPKLESAKFAKNRKSVVLTYSNVGSGLKTSDGTKSVKGFAAVLKGDCNFSEGDVLSAEIISENQIKITTKTAMIGIAYNTYTGNEFGKEINLCNGNGFPAAAALYYAK